MAFLKALSDNAEGPTHDQLFECRSDVPMDAGFSGGWAYNAIRSGLLQQLFPNHRVNVESDSQHPDVFFRVPPNFGRKLVIHD